MWKLRLREIENLISKVTVGKGVTGFKLRESDPRGHTLQHYSSLHFSYQVSRTLSRFSQSRARVTDGPVRDLKKQLIQYAVKKKKKKNTRKKEKLRTRERENAPPGT